MLAGAVGLLTLATAFTSVRHAVAETVKPVLAQIVNTVGVNVLNTPNVSVSGTPTVLASQGGPWGVAIVGQPIVQVESNSTSPVWTRDADDRTPFQRSLCLGLGSMASSCGALPSNIDAGGLRIVIEQVSGTCVQQAATETQVVAVEFRTHVAPYSADHTFLVQSPMRYFGAPNGQYLTTFDYPARIYVDAQSQFGLIGLGFAGQGLDAFCTVAVSGWHQGSVHYPN